MSVIAQESVVMPAISVDEITVMEQAATAFRARFALGQPSDPATFALLIEPFCPPHIGRRREWIKGSQTMASWHACVDD